MLKQDRTQAALEKPIYAEAPLQLLLFVDDRPSSQQQIQRLRHYLKHSQTNYPFELEIVNVGEKPFLAEQFKLVATPALIKIRPEPRQILTGTNLIAQLKNLWSRWQQAIEANLKLGEASASVDKDEDVSTSKSSIRSVADSVKLIQLSDEIFNLKRNQEKLLEQLQFKDQVIAMLAHDLRNPLTAVSLAIETLETNLIPPQGEVTRLTPALTSQLFKQARTQARSMNRMITGLLQVACGPAADLQIQPQKVGLKILSQEAVEHLSDRLKAKSQQLETDIPNDLPDIYADAERVQQVLINLLDNAIKYTPTGGIIRICGWHRTSQKVQVSICDSGPGIPEENRDRIFEDRFRLERDQAQEGYGIGLALCRQIILAHYGQIFVDSVPPGGSCFHFTLPVYPKN